MSGAVQALSTPESQIAQSAEISANVTTGGTQLFVEESGGSGWGFYDVMQLPGLMAWLESGSDTEQELADRIHETFKAHLQPDNDLQARLATASDYM